MEKYSNEMERQMRGFYQSLTEKDRRRYAAIEAKKLGHGGVSYIGRILGCDAHTIMKGMGELTDSEALEQKRIRERGGGGKRSMAVIPNLEASFVKVIANYTAGSPIKSEIKWTNLTQQEIVNRLKEYDIEVSVTVVKQLLKKHGFVRRKAQKSKSAGEFQQREQQFSKIAKLKDEFIHSDNPIISIDTKKKS